MAGIVSGHILTANGYVPPLVLFRTGGLDEIFQSYSAEAKRLGIDITMDGFKKYFDSIGYTDSDIMETYMRGYNVVTLDTHYISRGNIRGFIKALKLHEYERYMIPHWKRPIVVVKFREPGENSGERYTLNWCILGAGTGVVVLKDGRPTTIDAYDLERYNIAIGVATKRVEATELEEISTNEFTGYGRTIQDVIKIERYDGPIAMLRVPSGYIVTAPGILIE